MFPYLRLGPFLLQMHLLALLTGLWIGMSLIDRESKRLKLDSTLIGSLIFYSLIAGVIGARLGYVLEFPFLYSSRPRCLLALTPTTLAPAMGFIVGRGTFVIFVQREELP